MEEKNEYYQERDQHNDNDEPDSKTPLNVRSVRRDAAVNASNNLIEIDSTLFANLDKNGVQEKCTSPGLGDEEEADVPEAPEIRRKRWYRYVGLMMTVLSAMMFSIIGLFFKMLQSYHPMAVASWMFLTTAIVASLFYVVNARWNLNSGSKRLANVQSKYKSSWNSLESKKKLLIWARGMTGCSGMLLYFNSLQYLSIGDALVITSSCTVFVFLLAFIFLKESCGVVPVFTITLALLGVGIIMRPPLLTGEESFKSANLIGAAYASASMLSIASSLILMRFLQDVHHSLINLILGWWGALQTVALALTAGVLKFPQGISDGCLMMTTGLLFFIGQTFLAVALQIEEAGPVSLVRTSEVVFAFIWQILFLNMFPDIFSLTGAGLIMIGIVTTVVRKWISGLSADHSARQRLAFILK